MKSIHCLSKILMKKYLIFKIQVVYVVVMGLIQKLFVLDICAILAEFGQFLYYYNVTRYSDTESLASSQLSPVCYSHAQAIDGSLTLLVCRQNLCAKFLRCLKFPCTCMSFRQFLFDLIKHQVLHDHWYKCMFTIFVC